MLPHAQNTPRWSQISKKLSSTTQSISPRSPSCSPGAAVTPITTMTLTTVINIAIIVAIAVSGFTVQRAAAQRGVANTWSSYPATPAMPNPRLLAAAASVVRDDVDLVVLTGGYGLQGGTGQYCILNDTWFYHQQAQVCVRERERE